MKSLFQTAVDCEAAGDFGKAYELLTQCLSDKSHDPGEIAFKCGRCLENGTDSDRERAIAYYMQAFEKAAEAVTKGQAAFRAGWLLLQRKNHAKAVEAFKKVIDLVEPFGRDENLRHHALFWYAVSLEHLGRYLEAGHCHDAVKHLSPGLSPESAYRKIICHNHVGNYEAALRECRSFPDQSPQGFDSRRYSELTELIKKEERLLLRCLAEGRSAGEEL